VKNRFQNLPFKFNLQRYSEASDRVLGLRPFDVQLIGGMILHEAGAAPR
jgi:preprotein translocase subunit SecA